MNRNIVIFGRHSSSRVRHTRLAIVSMLKQLGVTDKYFIKTTLGDGLHDTSWIHNTRLLVIPGVYQEGEDLHGNVLRNIHTFIENGGSYLAMCAGAYTSCSNTSFKSGKMSCTGAGKINVFKGHACGSVYHPVDFGSYFTSRMVPICYEKTTNSYGSTRVETLFGMYSGGPEFIPMDGFHDFQVMARYMDHPDKIAVVRREQGKGRLILSGVYPMLMSEYVVREDYTEEQLAVMEKYHLEQRRLWELFLSYLLNVKTKKLLESSSSLQD